MIRSADVFADKLMNDPQLVDQIKNDPTNALPKLADAAKHQADAGLPDTKIYRIVVGCLGGSLIIVVLGIIFLSLSKVTTIPDSLTAIGSAAVGALAGLLAPSPAR